MCDGSGGHWVAAQGNAYWRPPEGDHQGRPYYGRGMLGDPRVAPTMDVYSRLVRRSLRRAEGYLRSGHE